jgi:hypothetical protein
MEKSEVYWAGYFLALGMWFALVISEEAGPWWMTVVLLALGLVISAASWFSAGGIGMIVLMDILRQIGDKSG